MGGDPAQQVTPDTDEAEVPPRLLEEPPPPASLLSHPPKPWPVLGWVTRRQVCSRQWAAIRVDPC